MEIVYATQRHPLVEGRRFQNPKHFNGPLAGASRVFLTLDLPKIAEAYRKVGVEVVQVGGEPAEAAAYVEHPRSDDERARVYIPDDWRDLPWSGPADAGITLRSLAAIVADEPVRTKDQAMAAIEGELKRRHSDEEADNGLTRRELSADLIAMDVDFDPTADVNDLARLRDQKRAERDA